MLTWLDDLKEIEDGPLLRFLHSPTLLSAARSDIREFLGDNDDGKVACAGGQLLRGLFECLLREKWLEYISSEGVTDQESAVLDSARKAECRVLALLCKPTLGLEDLILNRLVELKRADESPTEPTA